MLERSCFDYALDVDGDDPGEYPCECGSTRCRGTLVVRASDPVFVG